MRPEVLIKKNANRSDCAGGFFPLTPALSLGEREQLCRRLVNRLLSNLTRCWIQFSLSPGERAGVRRKRRGNNFAGIKFAALILFSLALLLAAGCAHTERSGGVQPARYVPPADGFQTHRAIFTVLGKQYSFNGYLALSHTGGKRLLVTENFGMVFADVLIKPDGKIYVFQSNKIFTPRRIKKYVAADLEALFGDHHSKKTPVTLVSPEHLILKRSFYSLNLRIVQTKPGAQPDSMFDETKAQK